MDEWAVGDESLSDFWELSVSAVSPRVCHVPSQAGPVHGRLQWCCVASLPRGPLLSALIHTEKECSTMRLHIMSTWKGKTWSLRLYLRTVLFSASTANVDMADLGGVRLCVGRRGGMTSNQISWQALPAILFQMELSRLQLREALAQNWPSQGPPCLSLPLQWPS